MLHTPFITIHHIQKLLCKLSRRYFFSSIYANDFPRNCKALFKKNLEKHLWFHFWLMLFITECDQISPILSAVHHRLQWPASHNLVTFSSWKTEIWHLRSCKQHETYVNISNKTLTVTYWYLILGVSTLTPWIFWDLLQTYPCPALDKLLWKMDELFTVYWHYILLFSLF